MKRILIFALSLVFIAACFVIALPFMLSTDTMRERIQAKFASFTDGKVTFESNPKISFNPFLGIELTDFRIQDPVLGDKTRYLLTVEKVRAKLDFLPAIFGQFNISDYQLVRPILKLNIYSDGKHNWIPENNEFADILSKIKTSQSNKEIDGSSITTLDFGRFEIVDGLVEFEDEISDQNLKLSGIDGQLNWPSTQSEVSYNGIAVWEGEILNANFNLANPLLLASGGESEVSFLLESNPVNFNFQGKANMLSNLFMVGEISAKTPSIGRITELVETNFGAFSAIDNFEFNGQLEATSDTFKLTDADFSVNGNISEGLMTLTFNEVGNTILDGTLAFTQFDANSISTLPITRSQSGSDNEEISNTFSSDIRISAQSFVSGELEIANVAANISTIGPQWTLDISDATIFNGNMIAKLGEREIDGKFQNFAEISGRGIAIEQFLALIPEYNLALSGTGDFKAKLSSNYNIETSIPRSLNGMIELEITNGNVLNFNLHDVLHKDSGVGSTQEPVNTNSNTQFSLLNSTIMLNNGLANMSNTTISDNENTISLNGNVNLTNQAWVVRASSDAQKARSVVMGGSINEPLILYAQENKEAIPTQIQPEEIGTDISN